MMLRQRLSFVVIGIALSGWSCNKSPTEPTPTYYLDVGGPAMGGYATFVTADGKPSLLEFHALIDGQEIHPGIYKYATPVAYLEYAGGINNAPHGHHTLELKVSDQTVSPTVYQSNGTKMFLYRPGFPYNTIVATVTLPDQRRSLLTGDSIVIEFDI